jgi:hypothetical protein
VITDECLKGSWLRHSESNDRKMMFILLFNPARRSHQTENSAPSISLLTMASKARFQVSRAMPWVERFTGLD